MTAERPSPSDQLARAIDRAVYASLRPVLASLSLLFFVFAVSHPVMLPPGIGIQMALLAGLTSCAFLGLFGALQAGRLHHHPPLVYSLVIAGLVLANALVHLHLVGNPGDTTNLLLFIVGAGFLLLSTRWLLICILVTFLGFYLVALEHPPFARWAGYIFALVSAAVLSVLVHVVRLRTVVGFEALRLELEDKVEERTRSLASERNLLRTLVDSLPDGVFVKDMGPNGSGKSTLAQVLAGKGDYEVTGGSVDFDGKDLLDLDPEERAREGLFLAFQYPVEIPGVSNSYFLKAALNAVRKHKGLPEVDALEFIKLVKAKMKLLKMDQAFLSRSVNQGFSGGEKKRNEIFQMAVLEPRVAVLDETDSGLDIDALRIVAEGVNGLRSPERSTILVTHYQRLLNYIVPDFVHVLSEGRIIKSGGKELALELEAKGYEWLGQEAVAKA